MLTQRNRYLGKVVWLIFLSFLVIPMVSWAGAVDVEAAKKDGKVVVYGTVPSKVMGIVNKAFEKKYGIKVEYWRAASSKIMGRALPEWRAGRPGFDVIEGPHGMQLLLREEGFYTKYVPPSSSQFPAKFLKKDKLLTPWRTLPIGILYNTDLVKPEDAPKNYSDLLAPKWKKNIGMPDPSRNTTAAQFLVNMDKYFGKGVEDWTNSLAKQQPRLVVSFLPVGKTIVSGEAAVGITFIKYLRQVKGPMDYVRLDKYLANANYFGLSRKAAHPNAGKLYIEFACSNEGQKIMAGKGEFPLSPKANPAIKGAGKIKENTVFMDVPSGKEFKKLKNKYRKIFLGKK